MTNARISWRAARAVVTVMAALMVVIATPTSIAQEPARLALLIGNKGYATDVGPLTNPHNDVAVVGEALRSIGFEIVETVRESKRARMLTAVRQFTARLRGAGPGAIGFVYYSGHGAAEADTNTNYLIPIDAPAPGSPSFWDEALKLDDILKVLDSARSAAKFVVFDACRNELAASDKSTTKGFVPVSEQAGMFIAYATAQGHTASDRGTRSGPYSTALAAEIIKPGIHHLDLFQNIKEAVSAATNGTQVPWERNGLARREYLAGLSPKLSTSSPLPPKVPPSPSSTEVAQFCQSVGSNPSVPVLRTLLETYRNTAMESCIRARLDELLRSPPQPPLLGPEEPIRPKSYEANSGKGRDQIRVVGSSTVYPFTSMVAEQFGRTGGSKTPIVESTGTGGGLKLFCAGVGVDHPDVANASRRITRSEFADCQKNGVTSVIEIKIGFDGVAIAQPRAAPEIKLTREQVFLALGENVPNKEGRIVPNPYRMWSDIDQSLPSQKIEVLGPPPTSGTRDSFHELFMEAGARANAVTADLRRTDIKAFDRLWKSIRKDGAYVEAGENDSLIVQKLDANRTTLGVFGYAFLEENTSRLKGVPIEDVRPDYLTISNGKYSAARPLFVYVKKQHVGVIPGLDGFVKEYVSERSLSPDGYLARKGLVALPREERVKAMTLQPLTALPPL